MTPNIAASPHQPSRPSVKSWLTSGSELSPTAKEYIIDQGFNPEFGARPLRRAIQRILEDPLAEEVLRGSFNPGTMIEVDIVEGNVKFSTRMMDVSEGGDSDDDEGDGGDDGDGPDAPTDGSPAEEPAAAKTDETENN